MPKKQQTKFCIHKELAKGQWEKWQEPEKKSKEALDECLAVKKLCEEEINKSRNRCGKYTKKGETPPEYLTRDLESSESCLERANISLGKYLDLIKSTRRQKGQQECWSWLYDNTVKVPDWVDPKPFSLKPYEDCFEQGEIGPD